MDCLWNITGIENDDLLLAVEDSGKGEPAFLRFGLWEDFSFLVSYETKAY